MKISKRLVLSMAACIVLAMVSVALLRQALMQWAGVELPAAIVQGAAGGGAVVGLLLGRPKGDSPDDDAPPT